jgi:hypothetical protein
MLKLLRVTVQNSVTQPGIYARTAGDWEGTSALRMQCTSYNLDSGDTKVESRRGDGNVK